MRSLHSGLGLALVGALLPLFGMIGAASAQKAPGIEPTQSGGGGPSAAPTQGGAAPQQGQSGSGSSGRSAPRQPGLPQGAVPPQPSNTGTGLETSDKPEISSEAIRGINVASRTEIELEPGKTPLIPVAKEFPNRIKVPFPKPRIVRKEGSFKYDFRGPDNRVLYVFPDKDEPIGFFLSSAYEDRSIPVSLVPKDIPPQTIQLTYASDEAGEGVEGEASNGVLAMAEKRKTDFLRVPGDRSKARQWEESRSHVQTIRDLMIRLARSELPKGYSLSTQDLPDYTCDIPNLETEVRQRVQGDSYEALVLRAQNTGAGAVQIRGPGCAERGVLAVAPWPYTALHPDEQTEIYVVRPSDRFREEQQRQDRNRRPRVIDPSQTGSPASAEEGSNVR